MGAVITVDVTYLSGETDRCECIIPDLIRAERQFNLGTGQMFGDGSGARLEHLCFPAWASLKRQRGTAVPEFDLWLNTVATVDVQADDEPTSDEDLGKAVTGA